MSANKSIVSGILVSAALGVSLNFSAVADTTVDPSTERPSNLAEIIVTAQKRTEPLQNVPISMSVLGGGNLDKSTFGGVTDALNNVPGISAVANQLQVSGTFLEIRGVSASGSSFGTGASTVGYYVDSVPFGMIRNALVPDPNVYDLKQIEVLRGPQGTLYGANALIGVVRVLTNDPDLNNLDFKARGVLSTTKTGGENYNGDMAVNVPIVDGKLAARVVVGDDHESGWINGPLGNHVNDTDSSNVRFKVSAQPTDALSVGLSAWHSQSESGAPSVADNTGYHGAILPEPLDSHFDAYGITTNYKFPLLLASNAASYVDYRSAGTLDGDPIQFPATFYTELDSRVFADELNLTSNLSGPWRWSAGAMYRDAKDPENLSYTNYPALTLVQLAKFADTSKSEAVYGEVGRRFLGDELQLTLGARYFHDDEGTQANGPLPGYNVPLNLVSATSSATTPRAVLSWFPRENLTAYASYSQGFRSGLPQDELVGSAVPNFAPLKPDKLNNYEMGVKGTLWNERVAYDAAVFYMKWRDIQQSLNVILPSRIAVTALVNGGSASGEGAEFSLKTQPLKGLELGADFSWNNLHFDSAVLSGGTVLFNEGVRPNDSPEYTAGLSARYSFPLGATGFVGEFAASGNYISPLNTTTLGAGALGGNSLLLTQGTFSVQMPNHWTTTLFVDNANNYHGIQEPSIFPVWDTRIRPRTYGVRMDYHLR